VHTLELAMVNLYAKFVVTTSYKDIKCDSKYRKWSSLGHQR